MGNISTNISHFFPHNVINEINQERIENWWLIKCNLLTDNVQFDAFRFSGDIIGSLAFNDGHMMASIDGMNHLCNRNSEEKINNGLALGGYHPIGY